MGQWLTSGRRRDVCYLLYATDGLRAQSLKTRLEAHYGSRIEPQSFYGALDTLESKGHVESHAEGLDDVYVLTDAGREQLEAHLAWVDEQVGDPDADGSDEPEDGG